MRRVRRFAVCFCASTPPVQEPDTQVPVAPDGEDSSISGGDPSANDPTSTGSNILIAYFSVSETDGTDIVAGASQVTTENGVVGNTQFIAQAIQQAVGGGSVVDCCKVVSAQAVIDEDIWSMEYQ